MTRGALTTEGSGPDDGAGRSSTVHVLLYCAFALAVVLVLPGGVVGEPVVASSPEERRGGIAALQTGTTASLVVTPNPAHPGEQVTLDATESTAEGDEIVERCEFDADGDGTFETTRQTCQLIRSYETVGEYDVAVRVVTSADTTATDNETLLVRANQAPVAGISMNPSSPRPGEEVTLSGANSSDTDGEVVRYVWSVDGETVADSTEPAYETTFESAGEYEVGLVVEDDDGAQDPTGTAIEVVENRPPTAALSVFPEEPIVGEPIDLDASGSTDPEGAIVAYRWDLDGDGTVERESETAGTTVTFDDAGDRTVRVVVVDDRGDTDETAIELSVGNANGGTGETGERTPATSTSPDRNPGFFPAIGPDLGVVPFVPTWLVLLVLLGVIGAAAVVVRRREAVESRIEDLRERVHRVDVRRKAVRKVPSLLAKKAFKKAIRKLADVVEGAGNVTGGFFEWIGRAIRRVTKRVADVLRRIGS